MNEELKSFFEVLNREENNLLPHFNSDEMGLILRCAINELDWYCYNLEKTEETTFEQNEQFYILQLGVVRLIQLALKTRDSYTVPVIMFRRNFKITTPVLNIATLLGMIEHGRRIAQSVAMGIGTIEKINESNFKIVFPEVILEEDYFEKELLYHYEFQSEQLLLHLKNDKKWKKRTVKVKKKLYQLVRPFERYFIGYDADPLLDDHFFGLAYQKVKMMEGFDTFHYETEFGGVRFESYILALTFIVSMYFRHEAFAETLIKKDKNIRLEDILTISSDTDGFVESLKVAVNSYGTLFENFESISFDQALIIFNILSCGRHNINMFSGPGSPIPLIIQCSDNGFIRCLTGAYSEPVRFLLESLKHSFKKDYDKNQTTREYSMQKGVQRILNDTFKDLQYKENIKIKMKGKIATDIDLVILEEKTGIIIFCQLKHQELYGINLHAKHIRTERLEKQVAGWLTTIESWMSSVEHTEIRNLLSLPKQFPELKIYNLVISKHSAYSLKNLVDQNKFIYASWPQFVNFNDILREDNSKSLIDLIDHLEKFQKYEVPAFLPIQASEWNLKHMKFIMMQEGAMPPGNN